MTIRQQTGRTAPKAAHLVHMYRQNRRLADILRWQRDLPCRGHDMFVSFVSKTPLGLEIMEVLVPYDAAFAFPNSASRDAVRSVYVYMRE
ncbi:hypothetical protein BBJ28_00017845 [Nothophytophthora sp. Chile5]|nr:hypothetical protein BBJ28_00017845 [Nothophytophthora sp. Chile5]